MLVQLIDQALKDAILAGGTEPKIIERFAEGADKIQSSGNTSVRAGFIHQRPYAYFVQPSKVADKTKCELGDILYVAKDIDARGDLISARAAFMQAKVGGGTWFVEPHQLEFLTHIRKIQFRFGNSVFKKAGWKPRIYSGLPHDGDLGYYLLIGAMEPLAFSADRVEDAQPLYQHGFSVGPTSAIRCKEANAPLCANHDSHLAFLAKLIASDAGADLSYALRDVVELVYKRIGWVLDPPEEFADNFIEDGRGMAIVEITSVQERDREIPEVEG